MIYNDLQDMIGRRVADSTYGSAGTNATVTEDFIRLAEAELNRLFETRDMDTRATASISDEYMTLPDDFGGLRSIWLDTNPKTPLTFLTPEQINAVWGGSQTGKPKIYSIVGNSLRFAPIPDTTYTAHIEYWLKIPALSDSATSNWLLTNHPDIYVHAVLKQYYIDDMDEARALAHHQAMTNCVNQMKAADRRRKYGGALQMQSDVGIY